MTVAIGNINSIAEVVSVLYQLRAMPEKDCASAKAGITDALKRIDDLEPKCVEDAVALLSVSNMLLDSVVVNLHDKQEEAPLVEVAVAYIYQLRARQYLEAWLKQVYVEHGATVN